MDSKNLTGVKVTYIETQFVTSDAAGFKDLVQRLTGRFAPPLPPPAPHRPLACRPDDDDGRRGWSTRTAAAGSAVPQAGAYQYGPVAEVRRPDVIGSRTPTTWTYLDDMGDFSDLFYVGASQRSDGCYGGFPY